MTKGFTGRHHSEETKMKMRQMRLGHRGFYAGKHIPEEAKKKLSQIFSGSGNPMYGKSAMLGKKLSAEAKEKIRLSKMGSRNPAWKGDNVSYSKLHKWVRKYLPIPEFCEVCKLRTPDGPLSPNPLLE